MIKIQKDDYYKIENSDPDYVLSVTQNGWQWTSVIFHNLKQLKSLNKAIEKFIKEEEK